MKGREKYDCPECGGTAEYECGCCGSTVDCEHCNATGLDPDVVDGLAFQEAERGMEGHDYSHELKENGEYIGRVGWHKDRNEVWRLLYADSVVQEDDGDTARNALAKIKESLS